MKPEVVYYGRELRSSLGYLALAIFFGGAPLAVFFTTPEPDGSQLLLAAILGVPLFALSIHDLGKSSGLFLYPQTRQLKYVEGLFTERKTRVHSYSEVSDLHLIHGRFYGKGQGRDCWVIRICLAGDAEIVLEKKTYQQGLRCASQLERAFGVHAHVAEEWVPPPDPNRSNDYII